MDTLKGVVAQGTLLADGFGVMDDGSYFFGSLAGMGWACRWSAHRDVMPGAVADRLNAGEDVPVTLQGTAVAEAARKGGVLKLKASSIAAQDSALSSNGRAKSTADASS